MEQMLDLLQDQVYWPGMTKDAERHIAKCEQCIQFKSKPQKAEMAHFQATYQLQLVHLDYLTTEMMKGGKMFMSYITDHFMRYLQALVLSSQTAKCTAQALWDQSVVHYGLPESIISDQS